MKITVFYGMTFQKREGEYFCNGAFGRFIDELAKHNDSVLLCVPVTNKNLSNKGYKLNSKNINVVELPFYEGIIGSIGKGKEIMKIIKENITNWDNIYLRIPTPFSFYVYHLGKKYNKKFILHIVGDTKEVVTTGEKYKGVLKFFAKVTAAYLERITRYLVKNMPTLVNGGDLFQKYNQYGTVKAITTSTIYKKEIFYKDISLRNKSRNKILSVGVLRHEKGISDLLKAINNIDFLHEGFELTIVGDGPEREKLQKYIEDNKLEEYVTFKGFVPLGEELLNIYKHHDIFIMPSISEGTPRVLTEAMANGLAIIATEVGGIPSIINSKYNNGILIPPNNPFKIKEAIEKYLLDDDYYYNSIKNGYLFAEKNTIENHVLEVIKFMKNSKFK